MSVKRRLVILVAQLGVLALGLGLWQNVGPKDRVLFSRPSDVWDALRVWLTTKSLLAYIPITLEEAALGLLVALVVAVVFATLLSASRKIAEILEPLISVLNAIPKIALAPLFLLLFGIGLKSKVYFVASGVVFIPFYSLFAALTTIDPTLIASIRMLGAGRWSRIREVYIPAVVGAAVASLRVSVAFSLLGAVIAELIASQGGIGYEIQVAEGQSANNFVLAGVFIISVIALVLDRVVVLLQRHFVAWRASA